MSTIEKAVEKMRRLRAAQQGKQKQTALQSDHPTLGRPKLAKHDVTHKICRLDNNFLSQHGYLTTDLSDNQLAEEYRAIKRPLLRHITGKGAEMPEHVNLIMVVSALPGEGKTYTAMNLAISMAMEKNTKVLLIDLDVVKPALTESLGLSGEKGLIDLLIDDSVSVPDVLYKTNIPKLSMIPAGARHGHSTELLASNEMKLLCEEFSARYRDRVIILDAPPLLNTSHARVIAHLAGQILFVTEAGKTLKHEITDAISQLDKEKIVGMVLNKSRRIFGSNYAYGMYGSQQN